MTFGSQEEKIKVTYLGIGTWMSEPVTCGFKFIPHSLMALTAA